MGPMRHILPLTVLLHDLQQAFGELDVTLLVAEEVLDLLKDIGIGGTGGEFRVGLDGLLFQGQKVLETFAKHGLFEFKHC